VTQLGFAIAEGDSVRRIVCGVVVLAGGVACGVAGYPSGARTPATGTSASSGAALTVDAAAHRHRISGNIYGMNFASGRLESGLDLTATRWGGNSTSRYNYTNHTGNTGSDYFFENIVSARSDRLETFVRQARAHGTQPLVTVPMIGWVAKKSPSVHPFACGFATWKYGAQQSTDPYDPRCGNGVRANGHDVTGNDPKDTSVPAGPAFARAMVTHLVHVFGSAAHGGVRNYELDNEPTLWNSTHRDVHPRPATYAELWSKARRTAIAIKAADRHALVDGPGDWGWCSYFYSAADPGGCSEGKDRRSHGDKPLAAWWLAQFNAYRKSHHRRLLDYFDEHFYPQESGVALSPAGDARTQSLRLRSTRALWDPHYTDESWTTDLGLGPVELIPRMRAWRNHNAPGTKLAISEYNWGGLESVNGALAQADVLGIFGRERLDRALLWDPPAAGQPGAFAFRIYRDYDGHGARFGSTGVYAHSAAQGRLAVYAALRTSGHVLTIVVINKTGRGLRAPLTIKHWAGRTARIWTYSGADTTAIVPRPAGHAVGGRLSRTYPAKSITVLALHR
jgi:hypothetical protein